MIGKLDFSQLEWRVAAYLSQDPVMKQEIWDGVDVHTVAWQTYFNNFPKDPGRQRFAKTFNFRQIFADERTAAYAYFMDHLMPSYGKRKWDAIVDGFYEKYRRFSQYHVEIVQEVIRNKGILRTSTGRSYSFVPEFTKNGNEYKRSKIYNYPVQGMAGGEIVPMSIVMLRNRIREVDAPIKMINTVHDEIDFDFPKEALDILQEICYNVTVGMSQSISKYFGIDFNVPLGTELSVGPNWKELETIAEMEEPR